MLPLSCHALAAALLAALPAMPLPETSPEDPSPSPVPASSGVAGGSLQLDRGEGELTLWIPPAEKLDFRVEISVGPVRGANVGGVELSTGVEPYRSGLPVPGQPLADEGRVGWIRSTARGGYFGYHVEHEYTTRHLPTEWPRIVFRDTQRGSENRRREQKVGLREGAPTSVYRSDGHCQGCDRREHFVAGTFTWQSERHCARCKRAEHRIWRDPQARELPPHSVDMLTAVYLARSLLLEGRDSVTFPLIDKMSLWEVTLERGERAMVETRAGAFDAYRVVLSARAPAGEEGTESQFEGLFGIRGNIDIWVHATTGVPVLISGLVPIGPLRLDVAVSLSAHQGTPPQFASVGP